MNYKQFTRSAIMALVFTFLAVVPVTGQSCEPLDAAGLKAKLIEMGYTPKLINDKPGKEKFQVDLKSNTLDIPVGFEISPSKNFIWLTAFLGKADTLSLQKNVALLKENARIQPCFFYITASGSLMFGVPVENRGVTNAILRRHTDKLLADVSSSNHVWSK
jgi:hypothetical protein